MAIVFSYTKSTNIVVVTEGTSGTPATFADFVTADRAGSVTLLAAWSPNSNTKALTYQITPVEKLALLISFVVAGKTAEADYIFITGTDAWDNAQTESINVSAGNGTYVTTKRFRTITNIDCSDNPAGGGTVWADGTVALTQAQWGVIWDYGTDQYKIDCNLNVGNGSTATYFASESQTITFANDVFPYTYANAEFRLGNIVGNWGIHGSYLSINRHAGGDANLGNGGVFKVYASMVTVRESKIIWLYWDPGDVILNNAIFNNAGTTKLQTLGFLGGAGSSINKGYFTGFYQVMVIISTAEEIHSHNCNHGFYSYLPVTYVKARVTNVTNDFAAYDNPVTVVDPKAPVALPVISDALGTIFEKYTCNIHVSDKDGNDLSDVTVTCADQYNTQIFSVSTDANGDIVEQTITYKQWAGTSETLTTYSPHKFTISKAGYQTLVLENITVDHPIVWHLELQQPGGGGAAYKNIGIGVN